MQKLICLFYCMTYIIYNIENSQYFNFQICFVLKLYLVTSLKHVLKSVPSEPVYYKLKTWLYMCINIKKVNKWRSSALSNIEFDFVLIYFF